MTIEPGLAHLVDVEPAALVDFTAYRACPVCRVPIGAACVALNGRVAGGVPDGVRTPLPRAHAARKRRSGR